MTKNHLVYSLFPEIWSQIMQWLSSNTTISPSSTVHTGHGRKLQLQKHILNYTAATHCLSHSGLQGNGNTGMFGPPRHPHPTAESLQVPTLSPQPPHPFTNPAANELKKSQSCKQLLYEGETGMTASSAVGERGETVPSRGTGTQRPHCPTLQLTPGRKKKRPRLSICEGARLF